MPKRTDINKVLIIGSGPIIIGQACEFDYSGTQACKALRKLGYEIVLVNSNPATIMTDPETADETYIEPLNAERLEEIIAKERPDALLPNSIRSSPRSILSTCTPITLTLYLSKIPFLYNSSHKFNPDCPPKFGSKASGRTWNRDGSKRGCLQRRRWVEDC